MGGKGRHPYPQLRPPIALQAREFEGNPLELSYFMLSNLPVDDDVRQQLLEAHTGGWVGGCGVVGWDRCAGVVQVSALLCRPFLLYCKHLPGFIGASSSIKASLCACLQLTSGYGQSASCCRRWGPWAARPAAAPWRAAQTLCR